MKLSECQLSSDGVFSILKITPPKITSFKISIALAKKRPSAVDLIVLESV